ncbi:MAG: hypothetical protein IKR75_07885 [Fibrobacter sp.]|nr:hypothetical protein [Fibrobacter sp.]
MNKPKIIATFPLTAILIIASFVAALLCTGCSDSDNLAGTAEEPNELAYQEQEDSSSSEQIKSSSSSSERTKKSSSSSSKEPAKPKSSSSSKAPEKPDTSSSAPASSSSSEKPPQGIQPPDENDKSSSSSVPSSSSFKDPGDGDTQSPPTQTTPKQPTLSDYIAYFGLEDMPFDSTVMASVAMREESSSPQDPPSAQATEFDGIGVHQFVKQNIYALNELFPIAAKQYKKLADAIANDSAECGLYLLNIRGSNETVGHLLTKVSPDTMTVVDIVASSCLTNTNGKLVRFLFSYCGDVDRDPIIKRTSVTSDIPANRCPDKLMGSEWVK